MPVFFFYFLFLCYPQIISKTYFGQEQTNQNKRNETRANHLSISPAINVMCDNYVGSILTNSRMNNVYARVWVWLDN